MILKRKEKFILFILLILIIAVGGIRQILFTNVNAQLGFLGGSEMYNWGGLLSYLTFLESWSISSLINLKWAMTIGFTVIYLGISAYALWLIFNDRKFIIWLFIVYGILFILSAIFLGTGGYFQSDIGYTMARKCMGALQSPFPLMLLIPAFMLIKESEANSTEENNIH